VGEGQGPIWLPMETGYVCGADTRLRHRVGLQGAIQRIYEAREQGRCGNGVRNSLEPGRLKTWDAVGATLFGLLMGAEETFNIQHSTPNTQGNGKNEKNGKNGEATCAS
jgi:hypothetical protein